LVCQNAKRTEVIIIEVAFSNHHSSDTQEIPINRIRNSKSGLDWKVISECGGCMTEEDWKNAEPYLTYTATASVYRLGRTKVNVGFSISVNDECRTRRVFSVRRGERTKIVLPCGVNLTAYYGLKGDTNKDEAKSASVFIHNINPQLF
jgi:hypothetical protein